MTLMVLDCDPGHDDALAIMLAAAQPTVQLLAISTVAGNQTVAKTTLNAQRICTVAGILDVPIVSGLANPLHGPRYSGEDIHGESGLDGPRFGPPTVPVTSTDAVHYLANLLKSQPERVTVVATGPLTNIATLLLTEPDVLDSIAEIVIMGGSTERGNVTPYAEFNIFADPEAAAIVLNSGAAVTMCGLNVTHQALADERICARIAAIGSPLAATCVELLNYFADTYRAVWGFAAPPLHDPVAVARVIAPDVVDCNDARVDVELTGTYTRGATVVELFQRTERQPNAKVAMHLDTDRFWDLILQAITTLSERNRKSTAPIRSRRRLLPGRYAGSGPGPR